MGNIYTNDNLNYLTNESRLSPVFSFLALLKKAFQKSQFFFVFLIAILMYSTNGYAYKVRIGTNLWVKNMAVHPENWSNTAAKVDELAPAFDSFSASTVLTGTPNEGEVRLTAQSTEWATIINQFNAEAKKHAGEEIMRTAWKCDYFPDRWPLPDYLIRHPFSPTNKIEANGCAFESVMFFDNAINSDPANYPTYYWTVPEVQLLRDWLDTHGRSNVKISYDARNNSAASRAWVFNDLVDEIHFEGGPSVFITNFGSRQQLLKDVWNNTNKKIVLMIPVYGKEKNYFPTATSTATYTDAYIQIRASIKWLGEFMGPDFLKSDRVVIYPTTYHPTIAFYPELINNKYANSITGIALSFIEQKAQFEAGTANPESYVRISNQTITFNAIATKTYGDSDFNPGATASSNLPVTYTSSNTDVATIENGLVKIVGVGTSTIKATQGGNSSFNPAPAVSRILTVEPCNQTITFDALPVKNECDADFLPNASANSGLCVTYTSSNTNVATIVNGKIRILCDGTTVITASQEGNTLYNAALDKTQTLTVNPTLIAPQVSFITPSGNTTLEIGYTAFNVSVNATDTYGTISNVRLYVDGTLVRQEGVAPYDWGITPNASELLGLSAGNHTIKVVATDNDGLTTEKSFTLTVLNKVTRIEAESFTAKTSTINTQACSEGTNNIGWIKNGNYCDYTLNVAKAGIYKTSFRVASLTTGGTIEIYKGTSKLGSATFAATTDWQKWVTVNGSDINLVAGAQTIRLKFVNTADPTVNLFNVNWFEISGAGTVKSAETTESTVSNNSLNIYPNPMTVGEPLTIEGNVSNTISVYNSIGEMIESQTITDSKLVLSSISKSGFYFVKVGSETIKLIVK